MSVNKDIEQILMKVQKPGRYVGGELNSVIKDKEKVDVRFAFCFPDVYEVGMSHLGMKILYSLINERENYWCERVFAPELDMEEQMFLHKIPLYALESKDPLREFDIIGFTLQYELCYTTVLNMLHMAGLPVRSADRDDSYPLVVAGGPCVCNPEPMADFIDVFLLGEGEENLLELIDLYELSKREKISKQEFLQKASHIKGAYVPSLYDVSHNEDGTIQKVTPLGGAPMPVEKAIIKDIDQVYYPKEFVVPFIDTVHDRAMVEVLRGCIRGCRFCQAGFIYRPFREKHYQTIDRNARDLCASTGYEEISLTSLSTSDLTEIEPLLNSMLSWTEDEKVSMSLPSLRVDNFSKELLDKIAKVRKSGLTFAPEAGSQRLRDAINKNVTEEQIMKTCQTAFEGGYTNVKLYFMLGLPTETMEDVAAIADTAQKVVNLFYSLPNRPKGRGVNVTISVACFVPKPFTPFEFEPQDTIEMLREKQKHLVASVKSKKISVHYHESNTSVLEGVLARGDRRLCGVIEYAWRHGCNLDSWDEHFLYQSWVDGFAACGVDPAFYANRRREYSEIMPWDHLDYGVSKNFLIRENKKAYQAQTTPNCKESCSGCGANKLMGGPCVDGQCK